MLTLMPLIHLRLQRLEIVRVRGGDFAAHSLLAPLPEAVEFLVDVHCVDLLFRTEIRRIRCDQQSQAIEVISERYVLLQDRRHQQDQILSYAAFTAVSR